MATTTRRWIARALLLIRPIFIGVTRIRERSLRFMESQLHDAGSSVSTPMEIDMSTTKRSFYEGVGYGVVAGIVFAIAEVIGALAMGMPPLMPVRMFASIAMGESAMMSENLGAVIPLSGQ